MIPKKSFSKLFFSPLQAAKIQLEFFGQNNAHRKKCRRTRQAKLERTSSAEDRRLPQ